jgi:hypothetical protein
MIELLERAIATKNTDQLDVIPERMLSHFLSQLPEDKLNEFNRIKNQKNKICHNPDNPLWDISLVSNGDRVKHKITGKIGIVSIYRGSRHEWDDSLKIIHKEDYFTMDSFRPHINIKYEDGTEGSVYPNQIERI